MKRRATSGGDDGAEDSGGGEEDDETVADALMAKLRMDEYDDDDALGIIAADSDAADEVIAEGSDAEDGGICGEEGGGRSSGSDDGEGDANKSDADGMEDVDVGVLAFGGAFGGGGSDDDDDDQGSDAEDNIVGVTDAVLLVANTEEDEFSSLEMHVYDESGGGNFYVHHDVTLPSLPLCLAWMDVAPCPVDDETDETGEVGSYVAVGTFEPAIEIWNLDVLDPLEPSAILGGIVGPPVLGKKKKAKKQRYVPGSHTDAVISLDWNRLQRRALASGGGDHTVKLWDVTTQQCSRTITHHKDKVQSVRWHPVEATVLATAAYDKAVAMLDARTPSSLRTLGLSADPECLLWDVHRPERILAASEDGIVACWDARTAVAPLYRFRAHDAGVTGLSQSRFVPGLMATCSEDKSVRLWDSEGGGGAAPVLVASKGMAVGKLFSVLFCGDSPFLLATGGSKGSVALWHCDDDAAVRARFGERAAVAGVSVAAEGGGGGGGGGCEDGEEASVAAAAAAAAVAAAAAAEAEAATVADAAVAELMDLEDGAAAAAAGDKKKKKKKKKAGTAAGKE
ncbi:unnamed protein product [Phaeothamnion confervicola]